MPSPNIIVIMADDMGYGDLGCYNADSRIPTPNMDRLAIEGMRFTDAHAASAVCTPSRYGLLTGRYCWRSRLKQGVSGGYEAPLIEESRLTMASMLKEQGYATACIGKWHVGLNFQDKDGKTVNEEELVDFTKPVSGGPNALGFDYALYNAGCGTCAPPYGFIENERFIDKSFSFMECGKGGPAGVGSHGQWQGMMGESWVTREADVIIAKKAREYIESRANGDKPFFLYLTPNAPHEPCLEQFVPEFARGKSQAGARGDLVWLFDWVCGEVMAALENTGQVENTLILVTSDNGALPGDFLLDDDGNRIITDTVNREFGYLDYSHRSNGHLRGYKAHIWDGGHRMPLIARWPASVQAGTTSEESVCLTDFMATCAEITGYQLPDEAAEDSLSVLPLLKGDGQTDEPIRETIVHHSSLGVFSIRRGKWKLVLDTKSSGGWPTPRGEPPKPGTPGQLYDMQDDIAEQNDLWESRPDIVEELTGILEDFKKDGRSVPRRS